MSEAYGLSLGYTAVLDLVKSISALTSMPTDEGGKAVNIVISFLICISESEPGKDSNTGVGCIVDSMWVGLHATLTLLLGVSTTTQSNGMYIKFLLK